MTKKTAEEKRLEDYAVRFRKAAYPVQIHIKWRYSPTWGYCPDLIHADGTKAATADHYGYDKLSHLMAKVFLPLATTDDERRLVIEGESGKEHMARALRLMGYSYHHTVSAHQFDCFTVCYKPEGMRLITEDLQNALVFGSIEAVMKTRSRTHAQEILNIIGNEMPIEAAVLRLKYAAEARLMITR
jgi:hypothetical protein